MAAIGSARASGVDAMVIGCLEQALDDPITLRAQPEVGGYVIFDPMTRICAQDDHEGQHPSSLAPRDALV
jgi:hypothetical protein